MIQKQKGFTLTEMMIVIAIIGVLAAFAIPSYQDYVEKGRLADAKQVLITLKQEYENAKMQTPNKFDTLEKAKHEVAAMRYKQAGSSSVKDLYTFNSLVSALKDNPKIHYMVASASPSGKNRSGIYMTANGNVYKCPAGVLNGHLIHEQKPAACKEKI